MVHQYKLNGYCIVLDTSSGSVHAVDPVAYDIIALYKTKPEEALIEEIRALYGPKEGITRKDVMDCLTDIRS